MILISLPKALLKNTTATVTFSATAALVSSVRLRHGRSITRNHAATGFVRLMIWTIQRARSFTSTTKLIRAIFGAPHAASIMIHQCSFATWVRTSQRRHVHSANTAVASTDPSSTQHRLLGLSKEVHQIRADVRASRDRHLRNDASRT